MSHPIIILGAGHAAYSLAREIRRHDSETEILLITKDSGDSYYKPNLSKALAVGKTPDQLVLKTRAEQEAALNITVMAEQQITAIETNNHVLELANGEWLHYSQLVFATGADSRRFEIPGNANAQVLHVNDLDEYRAFLHRAAQAKHVLIMGAGLVGCEFANDLHSQGIRSTLIDPAPYPLATLLPEALGAALQQGLSSIDVEQFYGTQVSELNANSSGFEAQLSNGEALDADLVLSAAGLSVNTALASQSGISCQRGITVNEQLQTNLADIYALGDCAEMNGVLRPFIAPIMPSVKALAQTLLGKPTAVTLGPMPVTVKTPCCPVVACPPSASSDGNWQLSGSGSDLLARYEIDGQLTGFACTGAATAETRKLQGEIVA